MAMVRSGRKTAEVSVIWWLLILLPQPAPSSKLDGAVPTVAVYRGELGSQLPPRNFTAGGSWKDRPHRTVSASTGKRGLSA